MNRKKYDVVALGELLIDFTEYAKSERGNKLFEANPGGAPCNVLALLNKLGRKTAFIGKVGNDQFGRLLCETINSIGIDSSNLVFDNEIEFLTGETDFDEGVRKIREDYNIRLICVTMGKDGSIAYYDDKKVIAKGFYQEKVVDTTGAGDTFCGSVLNYICENGINNLSEEQLMEMITFANAAASIVTTKAGAILSMPVREEINKLVTSSTHHKII